MVKDKPTFSELVGATAFLAVILLLSAVALYALVNGGLQDNTVLTFVLGVFAGISASGTSFFLRGKRLEPENENGVSVIQAIPLREKENS